jgi:hypothetical protein
MLNEGALNWLVVAVADGPHPPGVETDDGSRQPASQVGTLRR